MAHYAITILDELDNLYFRVNGLTLSEMLVYVQKVSILDNDKLQRGYTIKIEVTE